MDADRKFCVIRTCVPSGVFHPLENIGKTSKQFTKNYMDLLKPKISATMGTQKLVVWGAKIVRTEYTIVCYEQYLI